MQTVLIIAIIALAAGLVWAYRRGLQDGMKICGLKDKPEPAAVERAFGKPVKPVPPDPKAEERRRQTEILLKNIAIFDGTGRGQKDVQ